MFRDIGDKFGLIQAQIGVAKCLAQCKRFRDSMNSYQLAVTSCHETDNKVGSPTKACFQIDVSSSGSDWLILTESRFYWRNAPESWDLFETPSRREHFVLN